MLCRTLRTCGAFRRGNPPQMHTAPARGVREVGTGVVAPPSGAAESFAASPLSLSRDLFLCPAGVAQLAAHPTCNRAVGGSSPPVGSPRSVLLRLMLDARASGDARRCFG